MIEAKNRIHSQPTLEEMFIQHTGRGCHNVEKPLYFILKRLSNDGFREIFPHVVIFFGSLHPICELWIYKIYGCKAI